MAGHHESDENATTRLLARWLIASKPSALPARMAQQAKLLLLDSIGSGLAALDDEIAEAVLKIARESGEAGECSLLGQPGKTSIMNAVLANGVLIRAFDLNDYFISSAGGQPESGGHPSDNISVALAFGEARGRSGAEVLNAIVLGYEVYGRMQKLMNRRGAWDGVSASGLVAPAVAGVLMGLDEERLAHAIALGAARALTPAAVRSGHLSAAKTVSNALVAHSGVLGALMAEQGVTGPLTILDDPKGLRGLFSEGEPAGLVEPMSDKNAIMRTNVKTYASVATSQSSIAAGLELHKRLKGDVSKIARIEVAMADYPVIRQQQTDPGRYTPKSRESADHSFRFLIAVTLMDGKFGQAQFEGERWLQPHVVALMDKIELKTDPAWATRAPGGFPCWIKVTDSAGHSELVEMPYPPGFSLDGLDQAPVLEKFHNVSQAFVAQKTRDEIVAATLALDTAATIRPLCDAFRTSNKK